VLQTLKNDPSYNSVNGYYALADNVQPIVSKQTAYDIGQNWQSAVSGVLNNSWNSVCWAAELGLFCAVSESGTTNGRVMVSNDGLTWRNAVSGVIGTTSWASVCWSPELGLFCAVGTSTTTNANSVMISTNGTTWNTATTVGGDSLKPFTSVCWAAELGRFCAVSGHGTIITSTNGNVWNQTVSTGQILNSVCWSPELGIFCAVGNNFNSTVNSTYISTNGTNWRKANNAILGEWRSICWSPELNIFCAVSTNNGVKISKDGLNWIHYTGGIILNINWRSVCWSAELGLFCAVANSGTTNQRVMISKDGITWNNSISGVLSNDWNSVCWSPELSSFCALANSGTTNQRVMITNPIYRLPTTKTMKTLLNDGNYNINVSSATGAFPNFRTTAAGPNLINIGNGNYKLVAGALRDSIAIGNTILNASNPSGYGMIGIGQNIFPALTTGFQNIGIGNAIATSMATGYNNVFIGNSVATSTTSTGNTIAIGTNAGSTNTTGINNTYLGAFTRANAGTYNNSTALGFDATITASNQIKLGRTTENVNISGNLNVTGLTSLFGYFTTNVIGLSYIRGTTNTTIASGTIIPIGTSAGYDTMLFNTVGSSLSGGVFTAPITGYYFIYANAYIISTSPGFSIRLNATSSTTGTEIGGSYTTTSGLISTSSTVIRRLVTGNTIRFYSKGCTLNTRTDPTLNGSNCIIYLLFAN
jgi:hypothetical protein